MWCDNCLLLFPLRSGALAWAALIFLYSSVGGILLFKYGDFLYFEYPEWDIYGGISMLVALVALINGFALSNSSYVWSRVCLFLWPFLVALSGIRGIVMVFELNRGKSDIAWECANGGQMWGANATTTITTAAAAAANATAPATMPTQLCTPGFQELFNVMVVALLIDVGFQVYMLFLNWRFVKRLREYKSLPLAMPAAYY